MMRRALFATLLVLGGCAAATGEEPAVHQTRAVTRIELPEQGTVRLETTREESAVAAPLEVPPDRAWEALLEVYGGLGIRPEQLGVVDPRSRQLGIRGLGLRRLADQRLSRWIDCGQDISGAKADLYAVQVTLLSQLRPGREGGSVLHTYLSATARDRGVSTNAVTCTSTGALEREIARRVQQRAAQP